MGDGCFFKAAWMPALDPQELVNRLLPMPLAVDALFHEDEFERQQLIAAHGAVEVVSLANHCSVLVKPWLEVAINQATARSLHCSGVGLGQQLRVRRVQRKPGGLDICAVDYLAASSDSPFGLDMGLRECILIVLGWRTKNWRLIFFFGRFRWSRLNTGSC